MDFTIKTYVKLLDCLKCQNYIFQKFSSFIEFPSERSIILRHDVDILPANSLVFAKIQAEYEIKATYYFRAVPKRWNESIIREISSMGHEIGYHYEDLTRFAARGIRLAEKDLVMGAFDEFKKNLTRLREIVPVKTVCMHGSPMSKWDSRLLWKYYDYKDFGVIGEPYFDIDFNEVLYLTDTGRRWDGEAVSVRDKVQEDRHLAQGTEHRAQSIEYIAESENPYRDWKSNPFKFRQESKAQSDNNFQPTTSNQQPVTSYRFHSTFDLIKAAQEGKLPNRIMMTFHPQRWTNSPLPWLRELVWQNFKNPAKYFLVKYNNIYSK